MDKPDLLKWAEQHDWFLGSIFIRGEWTVIVRNEYTGEPEKRPLNRSLIDWAGY